MEHEEVEGPAAKSSVIGHGEMEIPLLSGKMTKAYHVPDFKTHILPVSSLNDFVDVLFSRSLKSFIGCFILEPGTRNIVYETSVSDGLYRMLLRNLRAMNVSRTPSDKEVSEEKHWYEKTGHIKTERYIKLMKEDPSSKSSVARY